MTSRNDGFASRNEYRFGRPMELKGELKLKAGTSLAFSEYSEDFFAPAGGTLVAPLTSTDGTGTPTGGDFVNDADGGEYAIALAATNEAESTRLDFGDQLVFDIGKVRLFEARVKIQADITGTGGVLNTADTFLCGLAAAHNATIDSNTLHAWFRVEGDDSNLNLLWESDDGTTDDDDNDTGLDYVDGTYMWLAMDFSNGLSQVKLLADVSGAAVPSYQTVGVASMAAASGNVQPYLRIQKAAAANYDHKVTIDAVRVSYGR